MNSLLKEISRLDGYKEILKSYDKKSPIYVHGLCDSSKAHFILSLFYSLEKNFVLVCENERSAKSYNLELNSISQGVSRYFPSLDVNFYSIRSIEKNNENLRLDAIISLLNNEKFILVTTIDAIRNKLSKKNNLEKQVIKIDFDSEIDLEDLKEKFVNLDYSQTKLVESKGQFSIRGSIIDIWPSDYENPIRIELFDTEVDSIRFFDKDSQRSIEKLDQATIYPYSELLYSKEDYKKVIENINKDIGKLEKKGKLDNSSVKLIEKYKQIKTYIEDSLYVANKDLITAYRDYNFSSIFDYLPQDSLLVLDDISRCYEENKELEDKFALDLTYQMENGEVFASFENLRIPSKTIFKEMEAFSIINISSILKRMKLFEAQKLVEIKSLEAESFNKNIPRFLDHAINLAKNKEKVYIYASSAERVKTLREGFLEKNFVNITDDIESKKDAENIVLVDLNSHQGFYFPDLDLHLYTSKEIFGKEFTKQKKKSHKSSRDFINYSDLEIGDYVVHENNGIGIYKGIEKIEVNSIVKDYVVIEYKGADKLFVPIDQMALVNKYIGNRGDKPKISSLGGNQWIKAKQRAKKAVDEIADELVELYAKRSKIKGHAFGKDTTWQKEFEESFLYEETYSQLRSIKEIKEDMESSEPMDRLLCGDVGYGKTEVALRAAFKAINDGYQVAFLVPTTILARQHYQTMLGRFKDFPVTCGILSRFSTPKEEKETLKGVKSGSVDIVVGTHRLLSKDVNFHKLGLLIIDEEQRFGVKHKEKLKAMKENIDVLTLSATPIPRTLQMSLTGIRDMSTLDEPPEERMPVNTYVLEYNPSIIRQAIEKELARDGQVYFVYNRVSDIDSIYKHLQDLVPDAKIEIAHGQMTSRQLEKIMEDFVDGNIDILLSTTIIETGMDIQNVNTIIVYDADMMGLSQLYQLKGRIGRSSRSSYAYFTYRQRKVLTEIGEKRLKSIKDFSDFGSGYKIAMRDLELRGAGNLLGESQSGHVESVGYDLYVKFLQRAVEKASGKEVDIKDSNDVYIDIKIDAYVPSYYIQDSAQKIEIYNRISKIKDIEDYDILVEDLIDRYGDIPVMVDNIMYVSLIKSMADDLNFYEIRERKNEIFFYYEDRNSYSFEELSQINESFEGDLSLDLSNKPAFKIKSSNNKLLDCYDLLKTIKEIKE